MTPKTTFTFEIPTHLIGVVGEILDYSRTNSTHPKYAEAQVLVNDFIDKIRSMSRQTADNHMAYFPHGNSIDREE